jgi:hypothetical protein
LLENGVVTLFRPHNTEQTILCLGTFPAWSNVKKVVRNDGMGDYSDDRFDVRLEARLVKHIQAGDLIFFGRAEAGCVEIPECRRIASVSLNNFGGVPHWHLTSEYGYR